MTRIYFFLLLMCALVAPTLVGCGGGVSQGTPPPGPDPQPPPPASNITVAVTPSTGSVTIGQTLQFKATVSNTIADPSLYAKDRAAFDTASAALAKAQADLAAAEDEWLRLEELREQVEARS